MPFGTSIGTDGSVSFALWAPGARDVTLLLTQPGGAEQALEMPAQSGGWFRLTTDRATAGSRYRYLVDGDLPVPDPASRFQPEDVAGPSEVVNPEAFDWRDDTWHGRPWEEAVIYELHVGSFSPAGSFAGVAERLGHLAELGVTAIELMPIADFPGQRNWGYDGVLPFAPDGSYGRPEDLKRLVQAAHGHELMVLLDVVYNHFGPEGNFLHRYAPQFFTERHQTPWGDAINFDGPMSRTVRDFYVNNALYWLREFNLDGLRFDAVHAIRDDSIPDILSEIASTVRESLPAGRHVHLVLENDENQARYLTRDGQGRPNAFTAQWNDDAHHAMHVLLTGETAGYYEDYAAAPARMAGRTLTEGFAYQGEPSPHRQGRPRGELSAGLPPLAFVNFLQNHDQIGNRALGERISALASAEALEAAIAVMMLAPSPPLLFMGEEWEAQQPFLFFCDFHDDLAAAVREGRRKEFSHFPQFRDDAARSRIPDPNDPQTFIDSCLVWEEREHGHHRRRLDLYRQLLAIRRWEIVPRLAAAGGHGGRFQVLDGASLTADWRLGDNSTLTLFANLGATASGVPSAAGRCIYATAGAMEQVMAAGLLPPHSAVWLITEPGPR